MDVTHDSRMKGQARRRYLVNGRFQVNHIISITVMVIFAFFVISLCLGWFYLHGMDDRLTCNYNTSILWRMGVVFLFFMTGMILWSIQYTRAIAGPIEALCGTLEKAAEGSFPDRPVRFRRDDLFKRLAAPLTRCLTSMQLTRLTLDHTLERIEELRFDINHGHIAPETLEEALGAIVRNAEKLD